ncbi:MAG: DNA helicase UvrD [Deltaproteobacteria bacterium]|nr:MAG: DNA helicase UvrD [Deltaproteobacteria bacterium]
MLNADIINKEVLNEPQYEAVTTTEGPVLVIAGAGSGKTRTLVYRVAHLVAQGVAPEAILLLTFTRKASQEMLWRAGRLLNDTCSRVMGGTFHGVANTLLRQYAGELGWGASFSIIDRADAEGILNLLRSSLGLGKKDKRFPTKRALMNIISGSINKSLELEDLVTEQYGHLAEHLDDILVLRDHYRQFKREQELMDYDDLLVNWNRLLVESRDAQEAISRRFSHIMVDEYQDTNRIQADIVRRLAFTHDNVMVVGDDSQSIYSFRGANFYNIMRFPQIFANTKIIKLEENYRSTQPILALANRIIANAEEKYTKKLFTSIVEGSTPKVYGARDERDEASFIVRTIYSLVEKGIPLSEIAVLFRSGFHSYKLELALGQERLDYEKRGGLKLTESAHMKDVIAFLRVLVNAQDTLSWNRILLQIEKVGPATARKISSHIAASADIVSALQGYPAGKIWKASYLRLVELFRQLLSESRRPADQFELVLNYYQDIFERLYQDDFPKRQKDLDQLKAIMEGYEDLRSFIDDTTLDPPENASLADDGRERLILSTIHSSKGLEFDAVFVIGLADGRFPHGSAQFGEQIEEERRLFYVAATRARKFLYLTYPRQLMTSDRQLRRAGMSVFLGELSEDSFQRLSVEPVGEYGFSSGGRVATSVSFGTRKGEKLDSHSFVVGARVEHPFFGKGVVVEPVQGRSVQISFDRHGKKKLHLDYANVSLL